MILIGVMTSSSRQEDRTFGHTVAYQTVNSCEIRGREKLLFGVFCFVLFCVIIIF